MVTTLSKVGNSMAVLLPKALRMEACFNAGEPLRVESPRKGVVTITAIASDDQDKLLRLYEAHHRIKERGASVMPWPEGASADDLLNAGKERRSDELFSL